MTKPAPARPVLVPETEEEREIFAMLDELQRLNAKLPAMYLPTLHFDACHSQANDFVFEVIRARWWHKSMVPVTKKQLATVRRALDAYNRRLPPAPLGDGAVRLAWVQQRGRSHDGRVVRHRLGQDQRDLLDGGAEGGWRRSRARR
jgi:hypothetical protein